MKPIPIGDNERKLMGAVAKGEQADLEGKPIPAELIRRIVLGLPLGTDEPTVWAEVKRLFGGLPQSCECPRTAVGISIRDAVITGRLELASATGQEGGPMCPLAFEECRFEGGLAGAHAHFSRLSFARCSFVQPAPENGHDPPPIDLSGAAVDSDLHLAGVHPYGIDGQCDLPRSEGPYLWIRLNGARIDGEIDLCGSHLRAPPTAPRPVSEDSTDALDLTLAEVKGDIQLLDVRCEGRLKARTAHIAGDMWMTGASLENPGEQAALIQGTRIDGFLMLDGGFSKTDRTGPYRKFRCRGTLKLEASDIGRSLYLDEAVLHGALEAPLLSVRDDVFLHARISGPIDMTGARIGGTLDAARLNLAKSSGRVSLKDAAIGRAMRLAQPEVRYEFRKARALRFQGLAPLMLVETLWRATAPAAGGEPVPLRRRLVHAAFLVDPSRPRHPGIVHLDGHADVIAWAEKSSVFQDEELARTELRRLSEAYVLGEAGFDRADEGGRWFENGLVVPPQLPEAELKKLVARGDWLAEEPLGAVEPYRVSRRLRERFAYHVEPNPLLQARFDLEGLTCDMLDDAGGRAWGEHWDIIQMNHFTYRRATWGSEFGERNVSEPATSARRRASRTLTNPSKSSLRLLWDRFRGALADWLWPFKHGAIGEQLRERNDYLEPWQVRRNWIYRQFAGPPKHQLISPSRYRIGEGEYRPQPFEQAIVVARAEGREEFAARFEMLKRRIEWRLFNQRIRWPLAGLAIFCGAGWLWLHDAAFLPTFAALVATWVMMAVVSWINDRVRGIPVWLWVRRTIRELILYLPALILLRFADEWWHRPFDFIVAFVIYLGVRFMSVLSHAFIRFGFGYLRSPLRAIVTLLAAFVVGWWGVSTANRHEMLVIDAEAVAPVVSPEPHAHQPNSGKPGGRPAKAPLLPGSQVPATAVVRELSCAPIASEPLYALDVLVPLVDLREESRCEVRRLPLPHEPTGEAHQASRSQLKGATLWLLGCDEEVLRTEAARPVRRKGLCGLADSFPAFIVDDHRFWWWLKALYAIAGWFIVSLALLTFAQVNRTHGEPAEAD